MAHPIPSPKHAVVEHHPVLLYFALTFAISWVGAFLLVAPRIVRGEPVPRLSGMLMFPVMLLGPSIAGIALTRILDGPAGVEALFSRMRRFRLPVRWYAVLLIPPSLILVVLLCMTHLVSAAFAPGTFLKGIAFGIPAGVFEEIGWTGFVFPKMSRKTSALSASIQLGLLWSIWHLPVIDFLGTASPHGRFLPAYFLAFSMGMTAMRVLIAWSYVNTDSLWLAQLLHISSTGCLVALSPPRVNSEQEALWYAMYALGLWAVVATLVTLSGRRLRREARG